MYAEQMQVIDDFLMFSELLNDDIDLICDFIQDKIPTKIKKYKRSRIKGFIENADYMKIKQEVNYLLDLPIVEYTNYKRAYDIKSCWIQMTLFDYL